MQSSALSAFDYITRKEYQNINDIEKKYISFAKVHCQYENFIPFILLVSKLLLNC